MLAAGDVGLKTGTLLYVLAGQNKRHGGNNSGFAATSEPDSGAGFTAPRTIGYFRRSGPMMILRFSSIVGVPKAHDDSG
jgi:hypothetical protein